MRSTGKIESLNNGFQKFPTFFEYFFTKIKVKMGKIWSSWYKKAFSFNGSLVRSNSHMSLERYDLDLLRVHLNSKHISI